MKIDLQLCGYPDDKQTSAGQNTKPIRGKFRKNSVTSKKLKYKLNLF